MGPNQQLLSALRLRFMDEDDFPRYAMAFDKPPLSVRNEWAVFKYLVEEIHAKLREINANEARICTLRPRTLSSRALLAEAVRRRDREVLLSARDYGQQYFRQYSELHRFGGVRRLLCRSTLMEELDHIRRKGHWEAKSERGCPHGHALRALLREAPWLIEQKDESPST
jgi:hypothetical protein